MKKIFTLFLIATLLVACKKTKVDGSSLKAFQNSTNDIASQLSTLQQVKFNEALYIIKKFGVEGENDREELTAMAKLLQGKTAEEIFTMADAIAQKEGIEWKSTAPPSLGNMKIFEDSTDLTEKDPSDVEAEKLAIHTKVAARDSLVGVKSIQIIPKLTDAQGNPITFEGATLETTLEIVSGGQKIYTAKNIMQDHHFRGFTLAYSALSEDKIVDGKIDIHVQVSTKNRKLKMVKIGEPVNMKALRPIVEKQEVIVDEDENFDDESSSENSHVQHKQQPKVAVQKFLNHVGNQNLRAAFDASNNPAWGSYDHFSNPNSGFGNVKSISIKNITEKNNKEDRATVNATYDVVDKNGNTITVNASFGLKNINGEWKIVSYSL